MTTISNQREPFPHEMPPPLDDCIRAFEKDLAASSDDHIPVERVFVLGAGFSRAFGFTTSADIVRGVMQFIESHPANPWLDGNFKMVDMWLYSHYPNWRESSPDLNSVVSGMLGVCRRENATYLDPLTLHVKGLSWENGNYSSEAMTLDYRFAWHSFEALLCIYLFAGLSLDRVLLSWAEEFIGKLTDKDVILTLNWDVIPEVLLTQTGKPFSRYEWRRDYVKIVKLHGSVDLFGPPNEKMHRHVQNNPKALECLTPFLWRAVTADGNFPRTRPIPFGRELYPSEWYDRGGVLIMPPFFTSSYGYKLIQFNWRKSKVALERAKQVFIIGYSLCQNDKPFCDLLRAVSKTWSTKMRVQVWNPDSQVAVRAKLLCGTNRVNFYQHKAEEVEQ